MTFADALKAYKQDTGRSWASIADELGISESFMHNLVKGTRYPKQRATVELAAKMLGTTQDNIDHLCGRVAPDIIEYLVQHIHVVEQLRKEMNA